jgi:hypothetical protein
MVKKRTTYSCTLCKLTFSRKFNAERHNNKIHEGLAVIFNKETGWKSDKRKLDQVSSPAATSTTSSFVTSESIKDSMNEFLNKNYNNLSDLYMKNQKLEVNNDIDNENEQMVLKIIGKLSPFIDKLDSLLLSGSVGVEERNQILAELIISSLASSDPFAFIKEQIDFFQSLIAMRRAILLISHYYKFKPVKAKETLKALVLNSPYIKKNKINLQK